NRAREDAKQDRMRFRHRLDRLLLLRRTAYGGGKNEGRTRPRRALTAIAYLHKFRSLVQNSGNGAGSRFVCVGAEVWTGLQGGLELAQIVRGIAERYDVDEQTVHRDVSELLDELSREGLLE